MYLVFAFFCFLKLLKQEQICKAVWWNVFLCFLQMRLFNERQSHFALTSSVSILKSGISSYAGISLASFDHQIKQKRSFFTRTFEDQTSVRYKEVGFWCFPFSFTPARECVQGVQSLEERLEDLNSLSLNFCFTNFVRTIEKAFV